MIWESDEGWPNSFNHSLKERASLNSLLRLAGRFTIINDQSLTKIAVHIKATNERMQMIG
jgi:hypothetical protein